MIEPFPKQFARTREGSPKRLGSKLKSGQWRCPPWQCGSCLKDILMSNLLIREKKRSTRTWEAYTFELQGDEWARDMWNTVRRGRSGCLTTEKWRILICRNDFRMLARLFYRHWSRCTVPDPWWIWQNRQAIGQIHSVLHDIWSML